MMLQSAKFSERPKRVLVIDDCEPDRLTVRDRLGVENLELIEAPDGASGLELCREHPPDLVLLDLVLPDGDGFAVLNRLKEEPRTRAVPVIMLSKSSETAVKARGLDLGAVDFISKPFDPIELRARVRVALRTKFLQDLLEERAHLDGLTGLANRLALEERLPCEWAVCLGRKAPLAVWVVDVDHFKRVNDAFGHAAGDEVLRQAAATLRSSVRATDFVARYGGEEYVVLAPGCDLGNALLRAEQFRSALAGLTIAFARRSLRVTASVGIAVGFGGSPATPLDLLARADQALYEAKAAGRNAVKGWHKAVPRPSGNGQARFCPTRNHAT